MKSFSFRLQGLLKLRKSIEKMKEQELAGCTADYEAIKQRISEAEHHQHMNRIAHISNETDCQHRQQQGHYQYQLEQQHHMLTEELESSHKKLEEARSQFLLAKRDSTVLEQLEKREKEAHKLYRSRQNQIEIGEQANRVWRRNYNG